MFREKVVVITGSTQGIGKRTAELLAIKGARIVINSRNQEKVTTVVEEFRSKGYNVIGIACDVSDYDFCLKMKDDIIGHLGRIDYLINNAALASKGALIDSEHFVFEQVYRVNVLGSLYPSKAFLEAGILEGNPEENNAIRKLIAQTGEAKAILNFHKSLNEIET